MKYNCYVADGSTFGVMIIVYDPEHHKERVPNTLPVGANKEWIRTSGGFYTRLFDEAGRKLMKELNKKESERWHVKGVFDDEAGNIEFNTEEGKENV